MVNEEREESDYADIVATESDYKELEEEDEDFLKEQQRRNLLNDSQIKDYAALKMSRMTPKNLRTGVYIGKDTVMANLGGKVPSAKEITRRHELEQLTRSTLRCVKLTQAFDEKGNPVLGPNGRPIYKKEIVFDDENFGFMTDFLAVGTQSRQVTSRVIGPSREAISNEAYTASLNKNIDRTKHKDPGILGTGRK